MLTVWIALAAAAPAPLPAVGSFPDLESSALTDFFGESGGVPVPEDAVEAATTEAVARVGIDFGVLNTQLAEERQAIEKQVKALEEKVLGLVPKVDSVTTADVAKKIDGERVDANEVQRELDELRKAHQAAMNSISETATSSRERHIKNEEKARSIFDKSVKNFEENLDASSSSDWWLSLALFGLCLGGAGFVYQKVQTWEKKHVL
jgi:hypothetical protein